MYPQLFDDANYSKKGLSKVIMNCFLNDKFEDIDDILAKLIHVDGDLQLTHDNDNLKASLLWIAVFEKKKNMVGVS